MASRNLALLGTPCIAVRNSHGVDEDVHDRFGRPEIIGFSLVIAGLLCSLGLALWLAVATIFMIKDRKVLTKADAAMIGFCLFVLVSLLIPQWPLS